MVTPGANAFALMFALESMARATLATVIPLQAYALFGVARDVSLAFLAVALTGLAGSFVIPLLIRRVGRRWVYPLGGACLVVAPILLVTETTGGLLAGMLVRVFGTACLNITLNLYIMDYIHKRDLVRSEPRKFLFSAAAWTIGPSLGVLLFYRLGAWAANGFSGVCALLVLANFWRMRLQDNAAVATATRRQPNPLASIGRFLAQPRLCLAWVIAFGRTCWWGAFMVYGPLLIVRSGADPMYGGLLVSAASAMLFFTPLWGRIGARLGLRRTIVGAFCLAGTATLAAGADGRGARRHLPRRGRQHPLPARRPSLRAAADGDGVPHLYGPRRSHHLGGDGGGAELLRSAVGLHRQRTRRLRARRARPSPAAQHVAAQVRSALGRAAMRLVSILSIV